MKRVVTQNLITQIISAAMAVLAGIYVTRALGLEEKGIYALVLSVSKILMPLCSFGVASGILFYISKGISRPKESVVWIFLASTLIGILSCFIFTLINHIFGWFDGVDKLLYIVFFTNPIYYNFYLFYSGLNKFNEVNIIQLVKSLVFSLVSVVLVVEDSTANSVVLALVSEGLLTTMLVVYLVRKQFGFVWSNQSAMFKKWFIYGIKSWVGTLAMQSNDKLDQVIVGTYISVGSLGYYSTAYSLMGIFNYLPNAYFPVIFNKMTRESSVINSYDSTVKISRKGLLIFLPLACILIWLFGDLITQVYGEEFYQVNDVLVILTVPYILNGWSKRLYSKWLDANGRPDISSKIQILTSLVGIIGYSVLIPHIGISGAIWGSVFSYLFAFILTKYLAKRHVNQ